MWVLPPAGVHLKHTCMASGCFFFCSSEHYTSISFCIARKKSIILKRRWCTEQQLGGSTKHKAFPLVQHAWLTGSGVSVSSVAAAAVWPNIFTVVAILWLEYFYCKNNFSSLQKILLKDGTKGLDPSYLVSCCHQTNMFTSCSWKSNCFYSEVLCHHKCGEMLWFVDKQ